MQNKKWLGILVLVLPFVVLAGLTAKAALHKHVGEEVWQVEVGGYDPRDLLYGHYLTFRYQWNIAEDIQVKNADCLCLEDSGKGKKDPIVVPMMCSAEEASTCGSVIKVFNHGALYSLNRESSADRYFIPEKNARKVEQLLRSRDNTFRMELMTHKDRSVSVRGLYIDDISLEDYLRSLRDED